MLTEDVEAEIDKLKVRRLEMTNRMNMTTSFDDKEEMKEDINRIARQIEILEKLKK